MGWQKKLEKKAEAGCIVPGLESEEERHGELTTLEEHPFEYSSSPPPGGGTPRASLPTHPCLGQAEQ